MKKNHINLFTPSLFKSSIYEIIYVALFKDYLILEVYHKNITDIDLEFNVQLSTSIYIDCIASLFNSLFK